MEVDYRAVDEEKESGGGALLHSLQSSTAAVSDSVLPTSSGQQQISKGCTILYKLQQVLIDAPVCTLRCYVAASLAISCAPPRKDLTGEPACELCGRRLRSIKHHRPHGSGRACSPRCKPSKHDAADAASLPSTPLARSHKRTPPDSGKELAITSASPPPAPASLHQQSTWHTHGWYLHSSSRSTRATATSWLQLSCDTELNRWERKRGDFYQHDTSTSLYSTALCHTTVLLILMCMIATCCSCRSRHPPHLFPTLNSRDTRTE
jgi:hypothetical protein